MRKLIEFGPDQSEALERMTKEFGGTQSAIVRAGLALFQIAAREARKGNGIGVVNSGRVVNELVGPWSQASGLAVGV